ncbi:MAG: HepT-like ribonuclease domain-containing protein [Thermoanaerobaculia bacterium]
MKSDALYLADITERIRRIQLSAAGGPEVFFASTEKQDAILHNLQLLGESVKRISEELKEGYPGVPWREIAAFRNVVVHDYMGLDLGLVWRIVSDRVPELQRQIERIVDEAR